MLRLKLEYVAAAGVAAVAAMVVMNLANSDVRLCRGIFARLAKGDPSVRNAIAWERFQAEDVNVGATYAGLPSPQEQLGYQQAFIRAFAAGFQHEGGRVGAFTHWRVEPNGSVAADYPAKRKTIVFELSSETGRPQLAGIRWQSP